MKFTILFSLFFSLYIPTSKGTSTDIVKELQTKQIMEYYPFLQKKLGKCTSEQCLVDQNEYKVFYNGANEEICFPYTSCGFYKCMEKKYQCMNVGVNYFEELAFPTCNNYLKNIENHKFSEAGKKWIYSVMVCLQKGLIEECEINNNCQKETQEKTCNHITEFTLNFHPGCYLNSAGGVCKLPLKDKLAIWKTVSPFLTKRERNVAYSVVFKCIIPKN